MSGGGPAGGGRPNVVVILLDDVGFGAASTFGGPIATPTLEGLAETGLRYNRFHTTAICSPTRASLLTGRDAHLTGVGTVLNSAFDHPAYRGVLRDDTASVARMLQLAGYATACVGKWHLTPTWESSQAGPFDRWPTGQGFDRFYGFLGGETHQFQPTLYEGTTPIERPGGDDYHLTEDLVDRAVDWIRMQRSMTPDTPYFLYLAPGATHAPLHVPEAWSRRYAGAFDVGWDAMREQIHARQQELGVAPGGPGLTPRPEEIPAWDALNADEQRVAARLMEVYAGFLEHTDAHLGRLVAALKENGDFDNTLLCYVVGDNGSSAEGGPPGSINYMGALQGMQETLETQLEGLDRIGGPLSYAQYPAGWAWAMTAPFQWMKQIASHLGGTRNPMVVSWPDRITDQGGLRSQFAHTNDLAPTILEAAGVPMPDAVDGTRQLPMDGTSLIYSFGDAGARERHDTQLFEVNGHRSIYHRGWLASAHHGGVPWTVGRPGTARAFEDDTWELYDLRADFSQSQDLATDHPERLDELRALFDREADRVGIRPLVDARVSRTKLPNLTEGRTSFTFHAGVVGVPESNAPRMLGRSWHLRAVLDVDPAPMRGVIATMGGQAGGWSLWCDTEGRVRLTYRSFEADSVDLVGPALPDGRRQVEVTHRYDGGGRGRGAELALVCDGAEAASGRVSVTPPAVFSIDETFDIGLTTGSPVGDYPVSWPLRGGGIHRVDIELDG